MPVSPGELHHCQLLCRLLGWTFNTFQRKQGPWLKTQMPSHSLEGGLGGVGVTSRYPRWQSSYYPRDTGRLVRSGALHTGSIC